MERRSTQTNENQVKKLSGDEPTAQDAQKLDDDALEEVAGGKGVPKPKFTKPTSESTGSKSTEIKVVHF